MFKGTFVRYTNRTGALYIETFSSSDITFVITFVMTVGVKKTFPNYETGFWLLMLVETFSIMSQTQTERLLIT